MSLDHNEVLQYCLEPLDDNIIVSAQDGEIAYFLNTILSVNAEDDAEAQKIFNTAQPTQNTLGYIILYGIDFEVLSVKTFDSDKNLIAAFGSSNTKTIYKPGDKVLCIIPYRDVAFPAIVEAPLTKEYMRAFYEADGWTDVDEMIDGLSDYEWDAVIVRPLVRIKCDTFGEMGETEIIQRTDIFPYKKYEL